MKEKYLPLGTVCMLQGGEKPLMVIGYCPMTDTEQKQVTYDYIGCLYPEGVISSEQNLVFNHDQIDHIVREIPSEPEGDEFLKKLGVVMFAVESGALSLDEITKKVKEGFDVTDVNPDANTNPNS